MTKGRGNRTPKNSGIKPLALVPLDPDNDTRTRMQQYLDGDLQISDMTNEELRKGAWADRDGVVRIKRHSLIPREMAASIHVELERRIKGRLAELAFDAVDTIGEVMYAGEGAQHGIGIKDGTGRLAAAQHVLDRVIGKIPAKAEVTHEVTPWEMMQGSNGLFIDIEAEDVPEVQDEEQDQQPSAPRRRVSPRTASRNALGRG